MKLFWIFLREHKWYFVAYCTFILIFLVTFLLCSLPPEALVYPTLLCTVFWFLLEGWRFLCFYRRHQLFLEMRRQETVCLPQLPPPEKLLEQDYRELLERMADEIRDLENAAADRYQEAIDYFTIWAHQIKTPIAVMRLTLQNEDTPSSRALLSEVLRTEQYVEMVLTYLRLGSESTDYVFREQNLDDLLKKSIRRFAAEFIGRHIRLDFTPTAYRLVTDGKWFQFVLEQLLSNALKYTPDGGTIRLYLQDGHTLCLSDSGIGIAPEDLPRIFEKGYTGCNGHNGEKASGIGLYLCRRICEALHIGLSVRSAVGVGTTVFLALQQYQFKRE